MYNLLQENLLRDLSSNSDILHDANLLASLKNTRNTSNTISEALESARALEAQTKEACNTYEESARRAAILTLAVRELTVQKPLVVLHLDYVLDVYVEALQRGGVSIIACRAIGSVIKDCHLIKFYCNLIIDLPRIFFVPLYIIIHNTLIFCRAMMISHDKSTYPKYVFLKH